MIVSEVIIEGYKCFNRFHRTFSFDNCIIGTNGCGKTTLLSVIAGVCGSDDASVLVNKEAVGRVTVIVTEDGVEKIFEATGRFDPEHIAEFKASLEKRVNYSMNEWGEPAFISERDNFATCVERYKEFAYVVYPGATEKNFVYSPYDRCLSYLGGDGMKQAISLFLLDSPAGYPVLLDFPGRSMDLSATRVLRDWLPRPERQLFYTTHSPEMIPFTRKGEIEYVKIIDMSQR